MPAPPIGRLKAIHSVVRPMRGRGLARTGAVAMAGGPKSACLGAPGAVQCVAPLAEEGDRKIGPGRTGCLITILALVMVVAPLWAGVAMALSR